VTTCFLLALASLFLPTVLVVVVAYRWGRESGATEVQAWWRRYDEVFGGAKEKGG